MLKLYRCECGKNLSMSSATKSESRMAYFVYCASCQRSSFIDKDVFEGRDPHKIMIPVVEIDWRENFEVRIPTCSPKSRPSLPSSPNALIAGG